MPEDDPRIKRVLKRYPKGEDFSDASVELAGVPLECLQAACRCEPDDLLQLPRELDGYAGVTIGNLLSIQFDFGKYDYFLHAYIRKEFVDTYHENPTPGLSPAPESGPHVKIPLPSGTHWVSARPDDKFEKWLAVEDE